MSIDINAFGRIYGLAFETFQVRDRSVRLAIANAEPPYEDLKEYISITGNVLLCPMDNGQWALVTSNGPTQFTAKSSADAVAKAKKLFVDNE